MNGLIIQIVKEMFLHFHQMSRGNPWRVRCRSTGVSDVDRDHFGAETGIKAQWFLRHPLNRATGGQAPTGHWSVLSQKC